MQFRIAMTKSFRHGHEYAFEDDQQHSLILADGTG